MKEEILKHRFWNLFWRYCFWVWGILMIPPLDNIDDPIGEKIYSNIVRSERKLR